MRSVKIVGLIMIVCGFTLIGASWGPAEDWAQKYPIEKDVPGPYSYEETAKKNYNGVTLRVITHEKPNLGGPVERHAQQFEALTGAKIEIDFVKFGDLYPKVIRGLEQKKYDVIFCGREWFADIAPYLEPLPEKMLNSPFQKDISTSYQGLDRWNEKTVLAQIDGDRHYLQYRQDLLTDPAYQAEFKTQFQRELAPPQTWQEYAAIAEFFNGRKLANGQIIYGSAEIASKDDMVYAQFIKRAAPYAKHPAVKGGFYFDLDTMKPLIDTPGFVQALQDLVEIQDFFPPNGNNFGLGDAVVAFGTGQTVFSDMWCDAFIKAMEPASPIRNHVAAALSPGSKRVWNRTTGKWDELAAINYVPYLPSSWTSAVSKDSPVKEAAFDFLGFYRNEANHASDLLVGEFGMNALLNADYDKTFWVAGAGWADDVAASYIETLQKFSDTPQHVAALNIMQARQYNAALNIGIARAMSKRSTPQEALDGVAQEWEKLTARIGVEKQREAYANAVKLEDRER